MGGGTDKAWRLLGLAIVGGLALVYAACLAFYFATTIELDVGALALSGIVATLAGLLMVQFDLRRAAGRRERAAEDLGGLSERLLRLETRLATLDGSRSQARSTLNDVAGDVHTLSEVVQSLAEALTSQEREVAALRDGGDQKLSFRGMPLPADLPLITGVPSLVPSFLLSREDVPAERPQAPERDPDRRRPGKEAAAIIAAALGGQVDLHVQAIVTLPQRRPHTFELYPIINDGSYEALIPAQYLSTLARSNILPDFEAALVSNALVFAHRLATAGGDAWVSIHLSPQSLRDPAFLRRVETLTEDHEQASRRLILEIGQDAWEEATRASEALARLRRNGVAFTLRGITDENLNPAALARQGVRHVRFATERLLSAIDADGASADLVTLLGALGRSGVEVIAEGVEDEVVVPELIEVGVPLAQGLAFALPCPAEAVLEQTRRAAPPPKAPSNPEPPQPDGSGPPQGSLRDFLRRAG